MDMARCKDCGEVSAPDYWADKESTNLVTQKYSAPYPVCAHCGSDNVEDIVAKADFLRDQMKERGGL